jgi:protein-disulfide isomerase
MDEQSKDKSMMGIMASLPAKTNFWLGVGSTLVVLIVVGFFALFIMMIKGYTLSIDPISGTTKKTTVAAADTNTNTANTNTAPSTADSSKVSTENSPVYGEEDAPVTIAYWTDYQCPFCQRNEQQTMPSVVKDYVDSGKAKIVYKDFQFLGADSYTLGKYARAVWETAPDQFHDWHTAIFENQGTENTGWATTEEIERITKLVFDESTTQKISDLVVEKGDEYQDLMDADKAEGSSMGVTGTPAFVIGTQLISGAQPYATVKAAIEAAL